MGYRRVVVGAVDAGAGFERRWRVTVHSALVVVDKDAPRTGRCIPLPEGTVGVVLAGGVVGTGGVVVEDDGWD